jgi:glycosyltransferase involved in cell wall biosynthesis
MTRPTSRELSIVVMTFNEEQNLGRCLESVKDLGVEIVVLDSYSTDRTVDIAKESGARVVFHPFTNHVEQRKKLLTLPQHDWILMLDADEYISAELRDSIQAVLIYPDADGYAINRMSCIAGRWIRHGNWYPDRKIRLFRKDKFRVAGGKVHESIHPIEQAVVGRLKGDIYHQSENNFEERMATLDRYSTIAAEELKDRGIRPSWLRIWFKPIWRFISGYFLKLGFLDGIVGLKISRSEGWYVWAREVKLREMSRDKEKGERRKEKGERRK